MNERKLGFPFFVPTFAARGKKIHDFRVTTNGYRFRVEVLIGRWRKRWVPYNWIDWPNSADAHRHMDGIRDEEFRERAPWNPEERK